MTNTSLVGYKQFHLDLAHDHRSRHAEAAINCAAAHTAFRRKYQFQLSGYGASHVVAFSTPMPEEDSGPRKRSSSKMLSQFVGHAHPAIPRSAFSEAPFFGKLKTPEMAKLFLCLVAALCLGAASAGEHREL